MDGVWSSDDQIFKFLYFLNENMSVLYDKKFLKACTMKYVDVEKWKEAKFWIYLQSLKGSRYLKHIFTSQEESK